MSQDFNWQNYIVVDASDSYLGKQIEQVLDQFAQTPEGKALIQHAFEVQDYKRIRITTNTDEKIGAPPGRINCNLEHLSSATYRTLYGDTADFSLNRFLYHEIFHQGDEKIRAGIEERPSSQELIVSFGQKISGNSDMTFEEANKYITEKLIKTPSLAEELRRHIMNANPREERAIAATNEFMEKYYGEEPRNRHEGSSIGGTPDLEVHHKINLR